MYDAPYSAQGVHWSDDSEDSPPPPTVLRIFPHLHHNIPPRYSEYSPTCIMISPHGTQDNPLPTVLMIPPHDTEHTLYRVKIVKWKVGFYDTTLSTRSEKPTYMSKLCMQFRYLQIWHLVTLHITANFFLFIWIQLFRSEEKNDEIKCKIQ